MVFIVFLLKFLFRLIMQKKRFVHLEAQVDLSSISLKNCTTSAREDKLITEMEFCASYCFIAAYLVMQKRLRATIRIQTTILFCMNYQHLLHRVVKNLFFYPFLNGSDCYKTIA